ncbi:zinc-ribbon domain-containing protein [Sorangium sp. So ce321]|uniref:zinc-ribbon domain-containing protein n=1 Tax=Sorangium sp. So ce321 TaxID=3133300 RepID=UPI003F6362DA
MKITCESCQAKYTIADEKVVGKTVKIKCKKCNHAMVVHGANEAAPAPGSSQDATMGQQGDLSDDADAGGAPAGASPDAWTVNVAEGDERTMTTAELVAAYGRGDLSNDTYVWKDGMGDWLPIASVPELRQQFAPQADAAPAAAAAPTAAAAAPAPAVTAPAAAAVAAVPAPAAVPAAAAAAVPVAPAPAGLKFGPEGTVVMKDGGRRGLNQPGAASSAAAAAVPSPAAGAASPAAAAPVAAAPAAGVAAAAPAAGAVAAPVAAAAAVGAAAAAPAAAAPAAARRVGRPAAVDVFSAAERATEPAAAPAPQPGADRQVGERNENSVLFSLSALTATENAAAKQAPEESPSGRRPSTRPAKNNGRTGYDDLLNLGGGAIASAPMLAPPPLLAPVGDSRPPPSMSSSAKASVPPASLSSFSPLAAQEAPAKRSRMGLIAAAIAAVVLIGGVAIFFMQAPKEETATQEQTNTAPAESTPPVETTAPTPPPAETAAAATPPPAETAAPSAEPAADAPAPGAATPTPGQASPGAAEKPAERDRPAAPAPAGAADKPAAQKPAEAAPAGGAEFNRGAASSALGAAASSAKSCKKAGGPTGTGKVKVTFAPSGNVTSAEVQGAPFAGTSVGGCVARLFRGARVPAFGGGPVSVSKSFTIN